MLIFSSCYAAMSQFILGAMPAKIVMTLPLGVVLGTTLALIVTPAIVLFLLGRVIRSRMGTEQLRRFHTGVMLFGILLYMRQAEIYSDKLNNIERQLENTMPLLANIAFLLAFIAVALLVIRYQKHAQSFFILIALPAAILTVFLPFARESLNSPYDSYITAEVGEPDPEKPPVIVLVFDEFSRLALLDAQGEIDSRRFPNFALLADESLEVEDAQSNFFYTWLQVPFLADSALGATPEFDPRLYLQLNLIEHAYANGCGTEYTCRGMYYMSQRRQLDLAFRLITRAIVRPIPTRLLNLTGDTGLAAFDAIGVPPPSASIADSHVLTNDLFNTFLSDIDTEDSRGRLYFVHSLLPHVEYIFDEDGKYQGFESNEYKHLQAVEPDNPDGLWEAYLEQVAYADKLLGKMIERLKSEGLWDDTVLVVTADHGARRNFPEADQSIQVENMTPNVPLFIKAPGIGPSTPHLAYQHVDFGPTLLDILDLPVPANDRISPETRELIGKGRSIFGTVDEPRPSPFYVNVGAVMYWRYDFNPLAKVWELTSTHKAPIPDKAVIH